MDPNPHHSCLIVPFGMTSVHDISMWNLPHHSRMVVSWIGWASQNPQTDSLVQVVLLDHMKSCSTGLTTVLRKFLRTFMLIFCYQHWHKNTRSALSLMESIRGNLWRSPESPRRPSSLLCREWLMAKPWCGRQLVLACVWSASKLSKYICTEGYTQINFFARQLATDWPGGGPLSGLWVAQSVACCLCTLSRFYICELFCAHDRLLSRG